MDTIIVELSQSHLEKAASEAGMTLTEEQSRAIAETEHEFLRINKRISFGDNASVLLVREFADSPFLNSENAAEALAGLTEAFYELREEFPASISDIEITESLKEAFNSEASGDVQLAAAMADESLTAQLNHLDYEIVDDDGKAYHRSPEKWHDDITVDGWFGERWEEDDE